MKDSDDIRRRIEQRLIELKLEAAVVSVEIGKNRGYLHDYLRKGTPIRMPVETKVKLAEVLNVPPSSLGVSTSGGGSSGLAEDGEPYVAPEPFPTIPLNMAIFKMRSRALDQHPKRILPGALLMIDLNQVDPSNIDTGAIVVANMLDRAELTRGHGTIIRQFVAPNKLVTNSTSHNEILSIDDPTAPFEIVIKGVLMYLIDTVTTTGRTGPSTHHPSSAAVPAARTKHR